MHQTPTKIDAERNSTTRPRRDAVFADRQVHVLLASYAASRNNLPLATQRQPETDRTAIAVAGEQHSTKTSCGYVSPPAEKIERGASKNTAAIRLDRATCTTRGSTVNQQRRS